MQRAAWVAVPAGAPASALVVDPAALLELPAWTTLTSRRTTIKVAGSQAAFRAIDLDAVLAVYAAGKAAGATRAGGGQRDGLNARSSVFYNRVKAK
jgi:hypothetical protein